MTLQKSVMLTLRPLERTDLRFVHGIDNDAQIMRYWFEEPFETFTELSELYDQHIHDQRERRFICENPEGEAVGLVELVEIKYINYAFRVLNLHKIYLAVDVENKGAIHIYEKCGFEVEGLMREEFYSDGDYHDALRMSIVRRGDS